MAYKVVGFISFKAPEYVARNSIGHFFGVVLSNGFLTVYDDFKIETFCPTKEFRCNPHTEN